MCNQRQHFCLQQFVTVGKQLLLGGKRYKVYMHTDRQSKKEREKVLSKTTSTRLSNLHFNLIFLHTAKCQQNAADAIESLADVAKLLTPAPAKSSIASSSGWKGCLQVGKYLRAQCLFVHSFSSWRTFNWVAHMHEQRHLNYSDCRPELLLQRRRQRQLRPRQQHLHLVQFGSWTSRFIRKIDTNAMRHWAECES